MTQVPQFERSYGGEGLAQDLRLQVCIETVVRMFTDGEYI